jgi:hypothetical protein
MYEEQEVEVSFFFFFRWTFPFSVLFFLYRAIFSERGVWVFRVVVHIRNIHNFIVYATFYLIDSRTAGLRVARDILLIRLIVRYLRYM